MAVSGERRLFTEVLIMALRDDDAIAWLQSHDGRFVCTLAGFEPEYLTRKLAGGNVTIRKPPSPHRGRPRQKRA